MLPSIRNIQCSNWFIFLWFWNTRSDLSDDRSIIHHMEYIIAQILYDRIPTFKNFKSMFGSVLCWIGPCLDWFFLRLFLGWINHWLDQFLVGSIVDWINHWLDQSLVVSINGCIKWWLDLLIIGSRKVRLFNDWIPWWLYQYSGTLRSNSCI